MLGKVAKREGNSTEGSGGIFYKDQGKVTSIGYASGFGFVCSYVLCVDVKISLLLSSLHVDSENLF